MSLNNGQMSIMYNHDATTTTTTATIAVVDVCA